MLITRPKYPNIAPWSANHWYINYRGKTWASDTLYLGNWTPLPKNWEIIPC